MRFKLLLAISFIPALVFAQPKFDTPTIDTSIASRNKAQSEIPADVSKFQQNQIRQDQQEAIDKVQQEIIRNEMIEVRPLLLPPSIPQ